MYKKIIMIAMIIIVAIINRANAQNGTGDNLPYTINASGGYSIVNGQMFDFNLGEMVLTETFSGIPDYLFSQGFLQPFFLVNNNTAPDVIIENNVITPNGDGKNDYFTVTGLDKHPGNKFSVYDRAGRKVYSTTDYKNNWDGSFNGMPLNEDAYYYVIDLGKNFGLIRGSISVILDKK